jgi:hypothetical protein
MLNSLRNRTASPAVAYFAFSRLILFVGILAAYHAAMPLEHDQKPEVPTLRSGSRHAVVGTDSRKSSAGRWSLAPDRRTYAEHAANVALQSARIADLHDEEQELLCETLVSANCDDMAAEACVAIVQQCHGLGSLHEQIVKERLTIRAIFDLGFIELEVLCEQTTARNGRLTPEQTEWREAYRTTLLEHLDALSGLLWERSKALKSLRTAVHELGGEAMLERLEVPRRRDAARAAADSILESAAAMHLGHSGRLPRDVQPAYDPRIPPCGGEVKCWQI